MPFVEFVAFLVFENPEVVVAAAWLRFFSGGLSSLSTSVASISQVNDTSLSSISSTRS